MADKQPPKDADVIIVGGGLAGLTAGVALSASGVPVTVLEKAPILGGRARSWRDEKTGDAVTVGPHIFLSEYPNMRKLLRILDTEDKIVWQKDKFITIVDGQKEIDIRIAPLPPPFNFLPAILANPDFFPAKDILSNNLVSLVCMQLSEDDVMRLDNHDALSVLRALGVTENYIRRFWSFTCQAIMNTPIECCSAGALLRFFHFMISRRKYDVGFADGGLGDMFAPQCADIIEKTGGRVILNTGVSTILEQDGPAAGVVLEDGTEMRADQVIATLPPTDLPGILPAAWMDREPFSGLSAFEPSPYISTYIWFDRKLTSQQFWARNYDENDMNCDFYDYANIYTDRASENSLITTNCIYSRRLEHLSDEEVVQKTIDELAEYLPQAREAKVTHSFVSRIPMAIHCPKPGTEQKRPAPRTPIKNFFLAGDWIRTEVPSSMESACNAGWQAAECVLADRGTPRQFLEPMKPPQGFAWLLWKTSPALRKLPYFSGKNHLR
ncbi:MAG: FAD-dependent oxidoreductase [Deltaproteobacteria bacterium]|nr:FAD-dependent oxidoreductase [Deltaproteobacteria bacterium]